MPILCGWTEIGGALDGVRHVADPRGVYAKGEAFGRYFVGHMSQIGGSGLDLTWPWTRQLASYRVEREGIPKEAAHVYGLGFLHGYSGEALAALAWVAELDGFEPDGVLFS